MGGEQKLKEGDSIMTTVETSNAVELLFWTNQYQVYKSRASEFDDTKASVLGDYVASKLSMDTDEVARFMSVIPEYKGYMIFVFENGKVAKVPLDSYETKTNRKKLTSAYSGKSKLVKMFWVEENADIMLRTTNGRAMIFNTSLLMPKASRDTIGVQVMTCKAKSTVEKAFIINEQTAAELSKYRSKTIPVAGSFAKDIEDPDQMTLI
jgi:DNA gyrase subunit A